MTRQHASVQNQGLFTNLHVHYSEKKQVEKRSQSTVTQGQEEENEGRQRNKDIQ